MASFFVLTQVGKSPCMNLIRQTFMQCLHESRGMWYEGQAPLHAIYSDGSHGGFNEYMRMSHGVLAFVSSEATNQLSPEFPVNGRADKMEYTDMKKLLDCATGGSYRWTTATEERARRQPAGSVQQAASPSGSSADARQGMPRGGAFDQPIAFDTTNVNLCLSLP